MAARRLSDFAPLSFLHIDACAISELQRARAFGMPTNAVLHILSPETERGTVGDAAKDNMDVRMLSIPVNHGRPLERSADITLNRSHYVSGEPFQINAVAKLRGEYELEYSLVAGPLPLCQRLRDGNSCCA